MTNSRAEYQRQYRLANPSRSAAYTKKWRDANKEKHQAASRKRANEATLKSKLELIEAYGGKCKCCGEDAPEFLTLDHQIKGDGPQHRKQFRTSHKIRLHLKKLGYPKEGYRLLCFNCNCAIGSFGSCPHERKT